jgi:hypothetical protein
VTSLEDGETAGVIGWDGARIKIVFLPPLIVITPSLLACPQAAALTNTNKPAQASTPDSVFFVISTPVPWMNIQLAF